MATLMSAWQNGFMAGHIQGFAAGRTAEKMCVCKAQHYDTLSLHTHEQSQHASFVHNKLSAAQHSFGGVSQPTAELSWASFEGLSAVGSTTLPDGDMSSISHVSANSPVSTFCNLDTNLPEALPNLETVCTIPDITAIPTNVNSSQESSPPSTPQEAIPLSPVRAPEAQGDLQAVMAARGDVTNPQALPVEGDKLLEIGLSQNKPVLSVTQGELPSLQTGPQRTQTKFHSITTPQGDGTRSTAYSPPVAVPADVGVCHEVPSLTEASEVQAGSTATRKDASCHPSLRVVEASSNLREAMGVHECSDLPEPAPLSTHSELPAARSTLEHPEPVEFAIDLTESDDEMAEKPEDNDAPCEDDVRAYKTSRPASLRGSPPVDVEARDGAHDPFAWTQSDDDSSSLREDAVKAHNTSRPASLRGSPPVDAEVRDEAQDSLTWTTARLMPDDREAAKMTGKPTRALPKPCKKKRKATESAPNRSTKKTRSQTFRVISLEVCSQMHPNREPIQATYVRNRGWIVKGIDFAINPLKKDVVRVQVQWGEAVKAWAECKDGVWKGCDDVWGGIRIQDEQLPEEFSRAGNIDTIMVEGRIIANDY
jgi:hypothetical protein